MFEQADARRRFRITLLGGVVTANDQADGYWQHDVFISHAWEDKESVAQPLKATLEAAGLKVWLDIHNMRPGDRLHQSVERGLRTSNYVALVASPSFLMPGRYWTEAELDMCFVAEQVRGRPVILPILHGISIEQLRAANLNLGGRLALSTASGATRSIDHLAEQIVGVVDPSAAHERAERLREAARSWRTHLANVASRAATDTSTPSRVGAVRELAALADESLGDRRQDCLNELCALVRRASRKPADREVQHEVLRQVRAHLSPGADPLTGWHSMDFDFTRADFDEINLMNIAVRDGLLDFYQATFEGDYFNFSGLEVDCQLEHRGIYFGGVKVVSGRLYLDRAVRVRGTLDFSGLELVEGDVQFWRSDFGSGLGTMHQSPFPRIADDPGDQAVRVGRGGRVTYHPNPYS